MIYHNEDLISSSKIAMGNRCLFTTADIETVGTVKQYQEEAFKMLKEIKRICALKDIKFFLMYGTLLGAMRHQGFVSWDDDTDIMMSRSEYNKFKVACGENLNDEYILVDYNASKEYTFTYPRLRKKNTTYILNCEIGNNSYAGMYVDIITFDYLSENNFISKLQNRAFYNLHRYISFGYSQGAKHVSYFEEYIVKFIAKIIGRKNLIRLLEKIIASANQEKSTKILVDMILTPIGFKQTLPKKYFESSQSCKFEGVEFPIPAEADELLDYIYTSLWQRNFCTIPRRFVKQPDSSIYYRDYKYIPPSRSRKRHMEVAFDMEHGSQYYTDYYAKYMNKKENNLCAIRESRHRERGTKYLQKMNEVSLSAFISVKEIQTQEFLKLNSKWIDERLKNEQYSEIIKKIYFYDIVWQKNLDLVSLNLFFEIVIKAGCLDYALRILAKRDYLFPESKGDELEQVLKKNIDAWYLIYDGKFIEAAEILNSLEIRWKGVVMFRVLLMVESYYKEDLEACISYAEKLIDKNNYLFIALYYKGMSLSKLGQKEEARQYFINSLNVTDFFPFLNLALKQL